MYSLRKFTIIVLSLAFAAFSLWFLLTSPLPENLTNRTWYLKSVQNSQGEILWKPKFSNQISLTFTPGGLRGSTGCNSYQGRFQAIRFMPLLFTWGIFNTLVNCLDMDVMDQEALYMSALRQATRYELMSNSLRIYSVFSGNVLLFEE